MGKQYIVYCKSEISLPDGTILKKGEHTLRAFFDILEKYRGCGVVDILKRHEEPEKAIESEPSAENFDIGDAPARKSKRKAKGQSKMDL